jgi:hypothetical protein
MGVKLIRNCKLSLLLCVLLRIASLRICYRFLLKVSRIMGQFSFNIVQTVDHIKRKLSHQNTATSLQIFRITHQIRYS